MGIAVVDYNDLREPNLRVPRVKPIGNVRIDYTNWAGKSVIASWDFQSSRWLMDTAGKYNGTLAGATAGTTITQQIFQGVPVVYSDGDGTSDRISIGSITSAHPLSLSNNGDFAIFFRCWVPTGTLNDISQRIIDKSTSGGGTNGYEIEYEWLTSDKFIFAANGAAQLSSAAVGRRGWFNVCLTRNAGTIYFEIEGIGTTSGTAPTISSTTAPLQLLNWQHSTDRQWEGAVEYIRVHNAYFNAAARAAYWDNPYQIVEAA